MRLYFAARTILIKLFLSSIYVGHLRIRDVLATISVVLVFIIGVISFFLLLPEESMTLNNFIGYMSSLSTIIMVLVYVLTTSRQLSTMREQLKEMEFTRNLQTQPLPFIRVDKKSYLEAPRTYTSPPDFHVMFLSRGWFVFEVENIGTGPAVAVDVMPKMICTDPEVKRKTYSYVAQRIESLKEGEASKEKRIYLTHEHYDMLESLLSPESHPCTMRTLLHDEPLPCPIVDLTILYRNVLGGCFEANIKYEIRVYDEDMEKLSSWLKSMKKAPIEYSEEVKEHNFLKDEGRTKEANRIYKEIKSDFIKSVDSGENALVPSPIFGSFSVKTIPEDAYQRKMSKVVYPKRLGAVKPQEKHKD